MANAWYQVFSEVFKSTSGNDSILSLAEFNGELFLGTGRDKEGVYSANVYRLTGDCCPKWKDVTPPWSSKTSGDSMAMQVFKGELYVGTDQGQVFRTAVGDSWTDVTHNLSPPGQIDDMVELKGYLYLSGDLGIWRTIDASSWTPVVGPPPAPNPYGFGDSKNRDQRSLEVFKDRLYVGIGRDNNNGVQLWRTADGIKWEKFQEVKLEPPNVVGPGHVHALKAFKDYLYLGEYHGQDLYRTDGNVGSWEYIQNAVKAGDIFRLAVHDGKLYLGLSLYSNTQSNLPLLYVSGDGKNWQPVPGAPTSDPSHSKISALLSFEGRLYVGTVNPSDSGTVVAWEWGAEIVKDQYEDNNSISKATPVKLPATTSETTIELTDLTLHDNDIDYFKIEYVGDPARECQSQSPQIYPLGGPFYAQSHPGYLSICACEAYGEPLTIEVCDSKGQKCKQYPTSGEVRINCPSQVFKDKRLYVSVSKPSGQPPRRYKLKVTYSYAFSQIFAHLDYKFWEVLPPPYPPPPFLELIDPARKYFDLPEMIALTQRHLTELTDYRSRIERGDLDHGLGQMAHQWGMYNDAERFLQVSLASFQELGAPSREADLSRSLGELYSAMGRAEEATEHLYKALEIHESLEDRPGLAQDHIALGQHHLVSGEPSESLAIFIQAQQIQSDLEDHRGIILNLSAQAEAFLALGAPEPAVACFILAEALWPLTENHSLREALERRESAAAVQIGEEIFGQLWDGLAGRAGEVWREAVAEVTG